MEGTVKFYNRKKGFGFINGDDGNDYFVHFTALPSGLSLRDNDRVSFSPAEGERGLKAENVQLLQKASERSPEEGSNEEASVEESSSEEPAEEPSEEATEESDEETSEDSDSESEE